MSSEKLFSFSRYLNFSLGIFNHIEKTTWLEIKVISKFITSKTYLTNNDNTHVSQYFTEQNEPDNKVYSKIMQKTRQED